MCLNGLTGHDSVSWLQRVSAAGHCSRLSALSRHKQYPASEYLPRDSRLPALYCFLRRNLSQCPLPCLCSVSPSPTPRLFFNLLYSLSNISERDHTLAESDPLAVTATSGSSNSIIVSHRRLILLRTISCRSSVRAARSQRMHSRTIHSPISIPSAAPGLSALRHHRKRKSLVAPATVERRLGKRDDT